MCPFCSNFHLEGGFSSFEVGPRGHCALIKAKFMFWTRTQHIDQHEDGCLKGSVVTARREYYHIRLLREADIILVFLH